ncbi:class I SAM-dependent methyltransferase family protein [Candidatus Korarchaeum cryptofilum]|uniref:Wybutosine (YW) biosynthesis enzyme n=2 Tax=Candidatus Korarchaeum cryptofilum TaxID=498846 RepID=B1L3D9_KORCO|nr:50S ribosomal protein L11 methyltransferase [Candidatus Korarchaeum cryptofilum]ACB06968.1 Wybutosine (yW) biosynthesis enzyme [Candidatus Korarchaeum cryptofilum OPF8]RSN67383.1 class I SAM-dependent methyltransferase family protein [Candidatus Korarchaeum cryptofilum]
MRIAYDLIGSRETGAVAIVDVPEGMDPLKVAEEILRRHPHVKSVLRKAGGREGDYRTRPLELIAGSQDTEVIHKEHGYKLKLDPKLVYFSPREATERQLLSDLVEDGELIFLMFAGVGPYAIAIARRKSVQIVGVEINSIAVRYFQENIKINGLSHKIFPIEGDVSYLAPAMRGRFDRVVMPLPLGAYRFIREALISLKEGGGYVHFYYWGGEDALKQAESLFKREAASFGLEAKSIGFRVVSSYAPRVDKIRIDFFVKPMLVK